MIFIMIRFSLTRISRAELSCQPLLLHNHRYLKYTSHLEVPANPHLQFPTPIDLGLYVFLLPHQNLPRPHNLLEIQKMLFPIVCAAPLSKEVDEDLFCP